MGRRTRTQKQTPAPEAPSQVPARGAELNVRAINLDFLLVQLVSDNGMSVEAYTIGYDQWVALRDAVEPWAALERPDKEDEAPEAESANPIPRLVGPTGEALVQ